MIRSSKELGGLANSLLAHLFSRNFDIEGFWGLGEIFRIADRHLSPRFTLQLDGRLKWTNPLEEAIRKYFQDWIELRAGAIGAGKIVSSAHVHFEYRRLSLGNIGGISPSEFNSRELARVTVTIVFIDRFQKAHIRQQNDTCVMAGAGKFSRRLEFDWGIRRSL
jgi:hypothetical protein